MRVLSAAAAAALFLVPGTANAKGYEIKLDGFCDIIGFNVETPFVTGISDDGCDGGNFVGLVSKVKGMDKLSVVAAINYKDQKKGAYILRFDYPVRTGGFWEIFYTRHGYRQSLVANGTYTNWHDGEAKRGTGPKLLDRVR